MFSSKFLKFKDSSQFCSRDFIPVTKDDLDLIFSYLPGCDLATISQVNKTCFTLMMNNALWKRAYELDFQEYAPGDFSNSIKIQKDSFKFNSYIRGFK